MWLRRIYRRRITAAVVMLLEKRRRRNMHRGRRAWVLPRNQLWFGDILNNVDADEKLWKQNFRVSRDTFDFICGVVGPELSRRDTRLRRAIPLQKRVAVSLWRLATGNSYRTCGLNFGLPKSTASQIKREFCSILTRKVDEFIKFPYTEAEARAAIDAFDDLGRFPQVIGAVDGTHIPIKAPKDNPNSYYNRKRFHSVVLQGISDSQCRFIDVSTGYPGRMHDARVFRISRIGKDAENGRLPRAPLMMIGQVSVPPLLLGDPAYRVMPYCMKPYPEGQGCTNEKRNFNRHLSSKRVVIEQAFGLLKARWRCLYEEMEDYITNVSESIMACCILHNTCINRGDQYDGQLPVQAQNNGCAHPLALNLDVRAGQNIRDAIADYLV